MPIHTKLFDLHVTAFAEPGSGGLRPRRGAYSALRRLRSLRRPPATLTTLFAVLLAATVLLSLLHSDGPIKAQSETGVSGVGAPSGPYDRVYVKLEAGRNVTCGVTRANNLRCWGALEHAPIRAEGYKDVAVGDSFACGVKTDGGVQCWGEKVFLRATMKMFSFRPTKPMGRRSTSRR